MSTTTPAPIIVVMGASGCGKSTIGQALADRLGLPFADADDFHPTANIQKMSNGIPLTDEDRAPWLTAVGAELDRHDLTGIVMACSALKVAYRDILRLQAPRVFFVHLDVTKQVLAKRMVVRSEHFMPLTLLESQLATLEPLEPHENGLTVNADQPVEKITTRAERAIRTHPTIQEHR